MNLPAETVAIIAIAAAAGVGILLAVVAVLLARLSTLRKAYASALDPDRREDLFQSVQRQAAELATLREDLGVVDDNTKHLRELITGTLSQVGLVRYDAFEDMGGALSFSAALLNEHRNGVVISAINGRSETRCYAKPVHDAASEHNLSAEEEQAIQVALSSERGHVGDVAAPRRGRRRAS